MADSQSRLLTLPRELRDHIHAFLILPEHVYTSSTRATTDEAVYSVKRSPETYIDTRIYLPARPAGNVLLTCRQLREEALQFASHVSDSTNAGPFRVPESLDKAESSDPSAQDDNEVDVLEAAAERSYDVGTARITLDIERGKRGAFGYYRPTRDQVSPRFLGLLHILNRLRRIKFIVWGGYEWWTIRNERKYRRKNVAAKKLHAEQTNDDSSMNQQNQDEWMIIPGKPNPLSLAIEAILKDLPLVEDIEVDILMHSNDYLSWDAVGEDTKGIEAWFDRPLCDFSGRQIKKVFRRMLARKITSPPISVTFWRKLEEHKVSRDQHERVIHISEGRNEAPTSIEDIAELGEPPYTKVYDQIEPIDFTTSSSSQETLEVNRFLVV